MRGRTCSNRPQATVTPDFPRLENSKRSEKTNKQIRSPTSDPSFGGGICGTPTLDLIFSVAAGKKTAAICLSPSETSSLPALQIAQWPPFSLLVVRSVRLGRRNSNSRPQSCRARTR